MIISTEVFGFMFVYLQLFVERKFMNVENVIKKDNIN